MDGMGSSLFTHTIYELEIMGERDEVPWVMFQVIMGEIHWQKWLWKIMFPYPAMYGIFTKRWRIHMVNVGK